MKNKWLIVIGALIVIIVAAGVAFSGPISKKVTQLESRYSKIFHQSIAKGLNDGFTKTAKKLNARGPVMVSKTLRWDKTVAGPGARLSYFYTFTDVSSHDVDPTKLTTELQSRTEKSICANSKVKPSIELGATYAYIYRSSDNVVIAKVEVNSQHCHYDQQ